MRDIPQGVSQRYDQVKVFLEESRLDDPGHIYFSTGKQRFKWPVVHCFDGHGQPIVVPVNCFDQIAYFIRMLDGNRCAIEPDAPCLSMFLQAACVMNVYDQLLCKENIGRADYYLFIDFIPSDVTCFKMALKTAQCQVDLCHQKIKLLLVNVIPDKHKQIF